MTDLQTLLLALTLIYGWECACWIQKGSLVFLSRWGRRWRVAAPGTLLGNHNGGFLFGHPLPPLGRIVTVSQPQLSISSRGVLAFVPPPVRSEWRTPQTGRFVAFDAMRSVNARGKALRINGEVFLRAGSVQRAQFLEAQLRGLRDQCEERRSGAIREFHREALAAGAVRSRWQEFRERSVLLRRWCNLLFGFLFVAAPAAIWYLGVGRIWPALLTGLLVCTVSIAIRARTLHRAFYPDAGDERFALFLTSLLSPPAAIRACDALSRPLLVNHHPLSVAREFLERGEFDAFARDQLLALRHPILPEWGAEQSAHRETERWGRELQLELLEEKLSEEGCDAGVLIAAPDPMDASVALYCPRCRAQFTGGAEGCGDCGGLILLGFGEVGAGCVGPRTSEASGKQTGTEEERVADAE